MLPDQTPRFSRTRLIRAGITEPSRALRVLDDPVMEPLIEACGADGFIDALCGLNDPLEALLCLVRLVQTERANDVIDVMATDTPLRTRLLHVIGASRALGDFLVAHPSMIQALSDKRSWDAINVHEALAHTVDLSRIRMGLEPAGLGVVDVVDGDTWPRWNPLRAAEELRLAYRERLVTIVADDCTAEDPFVSVIEVAHRMADLVDATLNAAVELAKFDVASRRGYDVVSELQFCIIALGKTGAQELNYISDVDVMYVVNSATLDDDQCQEIGADIAQSVATFCSSPGHEKALWPVDTALRPEGKDGALVRTVESYAAYYQRWAQSWEFQALLKARPCAGDLRLGQEFMDKMWPMVWQASSRENFIHDARAMRQRVETESASSRGDDWRIKLGPGGLRDVEFTVQLLQLVHGRTDERLHVRSTVDAINALRDGGYISRGDAHELDNCYRQLRAIEHRAQVFGFRRTHDLPLKDVDVRRIGRGLTHGRMNDPDELRKSFLAIRRRVRTLHEEIYYRPLLTVAATLSNDELALTEQAACQRLEAVGYHDPDGALRHIQAMTEGVSRTATIQKQLLPVMIQWLAQGPDPDAGLLSLRKLSDEVGGSHWYMAMLRDSSLAAPRLCHVLSGAPWTADRLAERPETIAWLDNDDDLSPRSHEALHDEIHAIIRRRTLADDPHGLAHDAMVSMASVRAREYTRAALGDTLDGVEPERSATILSPATDALIDGALHLATALAIAERDGQEALTGGRDETGRWPAQHARHAVIAMGRLGGGEMSYASDADVLFVYEPLEPSHGLDESPLRPASVTAQSALAEAEAVAKWTKKLLATGPYPLAIDSDVRPEGRSGPITRSVENYIEYYSTHCATWEKHALIRARHCAGDASLGQTFIDGINPIRYNSEGLSSAELRDIRRLKARMEAERIPRGIRPERHVKLGPGGLTDVEWVAQLLQLQHAGQIPALHTTSTIEALDAACDHGLIDLYARDALVRAWTMATRIRSGVVLGAGRVTGARIDALPESLRDVRMVGRLLGYEVGREWELDDDYLRAARRARSWAEVLIYGRSQIPKKDTTNATAAKSPSSSAHNLAHTAYGSTPNLSAPGEGSADKVTRASSQHATTPHSVHAGEHRDGETKERGESTASKKPVRRRPRTTTRRVPFDPTRPWQF
ncbi:bifunctional [glutamine synthetase] adenylyltransferase/[glutamine synthetase]-adenylyl-L-tyrosine phosphorylase [Actinomyces vulturis]|uniref:bifunctional [glutamine synthetase] adenylyltransferase/[glutamine synthetase]-adenylyl-L-tyrosine phosphorylase n=1 Tax=Actinomyces vulturis TaxID=1857645 RepID=UPI0008372B49|nr:bifunctional [glutamine synthetase] adenylyltransferase/[glutamine synthetase]-adenylyl-L-tyrosine phosphorylase [Actinomyces vulturis]